jgi:hypothetical protein
MNQDKVLENLCLLRDQLHITNALEHEGIFNEDWRDKITEEEKKEFQQNFSQETLAYVETRIEEEKKATETGGGSDGGLCYGSKRKSNGSDSSNNKKLKGLGALHIVAPYIY